MSDNETLKAASSRIQKQLGYQSCPLCWMPLYPAWQLSCCGERVCSECVNHYFESKASKCPSSTCQIMNPTIKHDKGFDKDTQNQQIQCPKCLWKGAFKILSDHIQVHCEWVCTDCMESFIDAHPLDIHKRLLCQLRFVSCPLSPYGCFETIRCADFVAHYGSFQHQSSLAEAAKDFLLRIDKKMFGQNSKIQGYENRRELLIHLMHGIGLIDQRLGEVNGRKTRIQSKYNSTRIQLAKIREESLKLQPEIDDKSMVVKILQTIENIRYLIDEFQTQSETVTILMDSNNTYTWKINSINLLDKESPGMHSDSFKCSTWGYRMQISAKIVESSVNGQKYLAVSFYLMQGMYDDILSWPLNYPITLFLVDLTGSNKDIVHLVSPDSNEAIFGKPEHGINQPWYIDQFCSMDDLTEKNTRYIQDNSMFIGCHIHFLENEV